MNNAMPEPVVTTLSSVQLMKICLMALFGATIHALIAHRKCETKNLVDILILTTISAFGGVIGGLMSLKLYPGDEIIMFVSSGMGGYLGVEGITLFVNYIKSKIKK
jgi:hypothetical protein